MTNEIYKNHIITSMATAGINGSFLRGLTDAELNLVYTTWDDAIDEEAYNALERLLDKLANKYGNIWRQV